MTLHESHEVTSWFYIFFIENNGMAFGMSFINKIALTSFRLIAVIAICYYIYRRIRSGISWSFLALLSVFVAGAAGNLIDCMFYGLCFSQSTSFAVSEIVPFGEGYASFFNGRVVDMFYFPLIVTNWPDWMPIVGGNEFVFFSPVFNFADAAVSCSVISALLFFQKELAAITVKQHKKSNAPEGDDQEANNKDCDTE